MEIKYKDKVPKSRLKFSKLNKYQVLLIVTILASALVMLYLMTQKVGMHLDEYLSYGCANHEAADGGNKLTIEYGVRVNAEEFFSTFFYPDGLSLRNAYVNQINDNQPPVYFILLHLVTLLTNHFLALKTGILLNIVIHMINVLLVWKILKVMLPKEYEALLGTMLYSFMPIVLDNVVYIRAYILFITFVLALTYLLVKYWNKFGEKSFYIKLCVISVLGILTHYYFILYLFFCCAVLGIYLIYARRWKELAQFIGTMAGAGIVTVAIFPYMIQRILAGDRGAESLSNATSPDTFLKNIGTFLSAIDKVYGGFLLFIIIVAFMLCLFKFVFVNNKTVMKSDRKPWLIILIPGLLFFLAVTWVAVMPAPRYIWVIYPICVVLLMGFLDNIISVITNRDEAKFIVCILLIGILLNNGYKTYDWPDLYKSAEEGINTARKYGVNNECIYVLNLSWHTFMAYPEFIQYQNLTFIRDNNLELLYTDDYSGYDHVVIYFDKNVGQENIDKILTDMINMNPGLNEYEQLHEYYYNVAYYLD